MKSKKLRDQHEKLVEELISEIHEETQGLCGSIDPAGQEKGLQWIEKLQQIKFYIQSTEGV
jgi:hypothetical protein